MLNPNALKWVEALESGNYKQGTGRLCRIDLDKNKRFYCLGVACDLAIENGLIVSATDGRDCVVYDGESDYLPAKVAKWLGLNSRCGFYELNNGSSTLSGKNDSGYSF